MSGLPQLGTAYFVGIVIALAGAFWVGTLAATVGVHYQTIGYIERGDYSPSLDLALRIAEYFELPVEAVFSLRPFPTLDAAALIRRA